MPLLLATVVPGVLCFLDQTSTACSWGALRGTGLNIKQVRFVIIAIAAIVTGAVTAFTGPIAFVGVVIPICTRYWHRESQNSVPATLL